MTARQLLNIPFTGGLDQKTSELVRRPGADLIANNVRQIKKGEWRQAYNFAKWAGVSPSNEVFIALAPLGDGGFGASNGICGVVSRTSRNVGAAPLNCVEVLDPTTSANSAPLGSPYQASGSFQGLASPSVWSRRRVAVSQAAQSAALPSLPTSIGCVGYAAGKDTTGALRCSIHAYVNTKGPGTGVTVELVNDETGAVMVSELFTSGVSLGSVVRCAYAGAGKFLACWVNKATNAVDGVIVNAVASPTYIVNLTSLSGIITGLRVQVTPPIDAMSFAAGAVTVIGIDSATQQVRFGVLNMSTGVTTTNVVVAQACNNALSFLSDPYASGFVWIGTSDSVAGVHVVKCSSVGAIISNDAASAVTTAPAVTGCALQTAGDWAIIYGGTTPGIFQRAKFGGVLKPELQVAVAGSAWSIDSQAWATPPANASVSVPMRCLLGYHSTSTSDPQDSYYEYQWSCADLLLVDYPLQAHIAPLTAAPVESTGGLIAQVSQRSSSAWSMDLRTFIRYTSPVDQGTSLRSFAVDQYTVIYPDDTTIESVDSADVALMNFGKSVQVGPNTFIPFGSGKLVSNGSVSHMGPIGAPPKLTLTQNAGGNMTALGSYLYVRVDVLLDSFGNIYRSAPSLPSAVTLTGANQSVSVTGEICWTGCANNNRVKTEIYRTAAGSTVYQKIYEGEWTRQQLGTTGQFLIDNASDATLASGDFLYSIGEVTNGIPPRPAHLCVANQRMWVVDADNRQRICFSKTFRKGFLPEFVDTFALDLTDDQGDITGLQALDDRVVVFKANAIYVLAGDGPDLTGAGAMPTVTRVSIAEGSLPGAVQCSTGQVVYFMAPRQGIYKIDRSLQVSYIGAAVDSAIVNPEIGGTLDTIIEALAIPDRNEVLFFGKQNIYVYNELLDCWSVDPRAWGGNNILSAMYDGTHVVVSDSAGGVWWDGPSVAQASGTTGSITTGWISAADLDGWLRLTRIRLLGQMQYTGTQLSGQVTVDFDYVAGGPKTVTTSVNLLNASTRLETELRLAVRCSSFRVTFAWQLASNSPTIQLSGIVAEVAALPGLRRLPVTQRMT